MYTNDELVDLYNKHNGRCSYGGKKVHLVHYGNRHPQGWEVEHGNPLARGGVDDGRNRRVACWACNRFKGAMTSQQWRGILLNYYGGACPSWANGDPVRRHT